MMAGMKPLLEINQTVVIDKNDIDGRVNIIKVLIHEVKNEWSSENIRCEVLSGGHISTIVKVWSANRSDNETVIVKILGEKARIRENPSTLATVMRVAEAGGLGAPVLARFNNGLVYSYTVGDVLNPDKIPQTDHILRLIATSLAKLNYLEPVKLLPEEAASLPEEPRMFKDIEYILRIMNQDFRKITWQQSQLNFSRQEVDTELLFLKGIHQAGEDEIVFGHGDCWWSNLIYNKTTDSVHLIDYDFSNYNYMTREIVNFFVLGLQEFVPHIRLRLHMPRESEKRQYIRYYLEAKAEVQGKTELISTERVEEVLELTKPAEMALTLDRALICAFVNDEEYPVDYIKPANTFWREYIVLKQEYLSSFST